MTASFARPGSAKFGGLVGSAGAPLHPADLSFTSGLADDPAATALAGREDGLALNQVTPTQRYGAYAFVAGVLTFVAQLIFR